MPEMIKFDGGSEMIRVWQCFECGWFAAHQGVCKCGRKVCSSVELSSAEYELMDLQRRVLDLDWDDAIAVELSVSEHELMTKLSDLQDEIKKEATWLPSRSQPLM